jgi:hypothetical protein
MMNDDNHDSHLNDHDEDDDGHVQHLVHIRSSYHHISKHG